MSGGYGAGYSPYFNYGQFNAGNWQNSWGNAPQSTPPGFAPTEPPIVVTGSKIAEPATASGYSHGIAAGSPVQSGFGFNPATAQLALSGISALGGLWNGFQQIGLAKKAFKHERDMANTNLRNQTQSYNTQLEDRIRSRALVESMSRGQADDYLNKNRLVLPASARG